MKSVMLFILNCNLLHNQNDFSVKVNISAEIHRIHKLPFSVHVTNTCEVHLCTIGKNNLY